MKSRTKLTANACDKFVLILESFTRCLQCGRSKYARILSLGQDEIDKELSVYEYLESVRMVKAMMNTLTTFNQRRLLAHQVQTSFLLRPPSKEEQEKQKRLEIKLKKQNQPGFLNTDSSSEEDFAWLDKKTFGGENLDEVESRLLKGIIQAPPEMKKRHDTQDPEDIRRQRRLKRADLGLSLSDSYDDEVDEDELELNMRTIINQDESKERIQVDEEKFKHKIYPQNSG